MTNSNKDLGLFSTNKPSALRFYVSVRIFKKYKGAFRYIIYRTRNSENIRLARTVC